MLPYQDADHFVWRQVGEVFRCRTRDEAVRRIERNGYRLGDRARLVTIGEGEP